MITHGREQPYVTLCSNCGSLTEGVRGNRSHGDDELWKKCRHWFHKGDEARPNTHKQSAVAHLHTAPRSSNWHTASAHTFTLFLISRDADQPNQVGRSRCGTPQWSVWVTTLLTHQSSLGCKSTPLFGCSVCEAQSRKPALKHVKWTS